jgi:hypothetical protein
MKNVHPLDFIHLTRKRAKSMQGQLEVRASSHDVMIFKAFLRYVGMY